MVQQELYDKGTKLKVSELKAELEALGAVTSGKKNDLLDRLVALQLDEAIQTAPPVAAAIQTAVEATAAASAVPELPCK